MLPMPQLLLALSVVQTTMMVFGSLSYPMIQDHFLPLVIYPSLVDPFAAYSLGVGLFLFALWAFFSPHRSKTIPSASDALQILLHIFTPCSSSWPSQYVSLAKSRQFKTLQISLNRVIQDVISGQIELRTPENTLQQLMSGNGQLQIEAWRLFFSYRSLRPKILYQSCVWSIFPGKYLPLRLLPNPEYAQGSALSSSRSNTAESISTRHPSNLVSCCHTTPDVAYSIPEAVSVLPALLPTFSSHILRKIAVATTLDSTPQAHLETALLDLQASIPPGLLALLEFTTYEVAPSVWSTPWLLSLLPFIYPASHSSHVLLKCQKRVASVPPLRTGLPSIITLLESGTQPCKILSIQNVSTQQTQLLNEYARKLEGQAGRRRFLASSGNSESALCALRAEIFWARWEAACYACGHLTRWVICTKKPTG